MSCGSAKENRRFSWMSPRLMRQHRPEEPLAAAHRASAQRRTSSRLQQERYRGQSKLSRDRCLIRKRRRSAIFLFPATPSLLKSQHRCRSDSLVNLYNSDWPLAAILDLSVNRVTGGYEDYDAAIDAMIDLDAYGALILAATSNNSLTLYPAKRNVADRQTTCDGKQSRNAEGIVDVLWRRLAYYINGSGGSASSITIRSKATESPNGKGPPPFLQTRSALGVVKSATETTGRPSIAFLPPEDVRRIIDDYKIRSAFCRQLFYTLVPTAFQPSVFGHGGEFKAPTETETEVGGVISQRDRSLITMNTDKVVLTSQELRVESDLVNARKFMLVAVSDTPQDNAFASVNHGGKWYSIFDDDEVSKRTLALIIQINTIQAIPSQSAPLTPTISVGAR